MFERIEALMDRIVPKFAKKQAERLQETEEEVKKSRAIRTKVENDVFESYRKAGIVIAAGASRRRIID